MKPYYQTSTQEITKKCRDCGKEFVITEEEQEWLKANDLELYSRCPDCRKARREEKETTEPVEKVCRECGNKFVITAEELIWLKQKRYQEFSRCQPCRKKKREESANGRGKEGSN